MSNISYENQKRALDKVAELKAKTKEIYPDLELPHVPVSFNLRGQTAGMVRYRGGKIKDLRLNLDILNNPKHTDDFIAQTVPHEWAHVIQRVKHGHRDAYGRRIKPHGYEWKKIMRELGRRGQTLPQLRGDKGPKGSDGGIPMRQMRKDA